MNSKRELVKVTEEINKLALAAFQSLGSGFKEETFQKALSIDQFYDLGNFYFLKNL